MPSCCGYGKSDFGAGPFGARPGALIHLQLMPNGENLPFGLHRGSPFRPCSQSRFALQDPSPQSPVSNFHWPSLPYIFSRTNGRLATRLFDVRFTMLIKVRELP